MALQPERLKVVFMEFFMYAAAFLFCIDDSPFMFGSGYKPISVLLIIVYLLFQLPKLFRLRYRRIEFFIFAFLVVCLLISFVQVTMNHYQFVGLINASETLGSGFACYLAFKLFVNECDGDDTKFTKLFLWMIRGYSIAVAVGFLEFLYVYGAPSGFLSSIIHFFVERAGYISDGRIHFSFSEPSFISLHTNLLLLPAVVILKNKGLLTRYHKMIVVLFFILSLFSLSIRFYLDILVFIVAYLFLTSNSRIFFKRMFVLLLSCAAVIVLTNMIFVQNIFGLNSYHFYRMANMIENPGSAGNDTSTMIRATYTRIGFESFMDHPLIGYGLGNYHYAYVAHFNSINPADLQKAQELSNAVDDYNLHTYDMFARLASEMGLLGIAAFLLTLYFALSLRGGNFSKLMIFLVVYSQLQFDSLSLIQLYLWIALLQSKYIADLKIGYSLDNRLSETATQYFKVGSFSNLPKPEEQVGINHDHRLSIVKET